MFLLALLAHARGLGGGFVLDDVRFVRDNPALAGVGNPARFFADPRTADPGNAPDIYRPLRTLNFALDRALFGGSPLGYHVEALLLHALNAVLVFLLLRRLSGTVLPAAAGAAFFAVHPAQVESVAWISSRGDLLAGAFTLLAVLAWLRSGGADRWYAAALGLGLLAAFSKEAAVVFPGFFVVADLARPEGGGARGLAARWRLHLLPLLFAAAFALVVGDLLREARGLPLGHLLGWWGGSYGAEFGTAMRAGAYQALSAVLPLRPSLDWYMTPSATAFGGGAVPALLVHAAALGLALRLVVRGGPGARLAGAGVLAAYLGGLATSHLLYPVGIPTAERFLYLPLVGAGMVVAVLYARAARAGPRAAPALAAVALLALGAIAAHRAGAWSDEETLWREGPSGAFSPRATRHLLSRRDAAAAELLAPAVAADRAGDAARARALAGKSRGALEAIAREAAALNDFWTRTIGVRFEKFLEARVRRNLSAARLLCGDAEGALREARAAASPDPESPGALQAEANALLALGRAREAGWRIEAALRSGAETVDAPDAIQVLEAAAVDRQARGLPGAAMRALRRSIALVGNPARYEAVPVLREMEAAAERARGDAARAVRERPADGEARMAEVRVLGVIAGDPAGAGALFRKYFEGAPDLPALRVLWGLATMEADDTEEGWRAAEVYHAETLRRYPGRADALLALARCREALGDPAGAAARRREVLALPDAGADVRKEAEEGLKRIR